MIIQFKTKKGTTIQKGQNNYKVFIANSNPVKHNLTVKMKNAAQNLEIEDAIILNEADKGGTIVYMDKYFFYKTLVQHLNDDHFIQNEHFLKDNELDFLTQTSNFP